MPEGQFGYTTDYWRRPTQGFKEEKKLFTPDYSYFRNFINDRELSAARERVYYERYGMNEGDYNSARARHRAVLYDFVLNEYEQIQEAVGYKPGYGLQIITGRDDENIAATFNTPPDAAWVNPTQAFIDRNWDILDRMREAAYNARFPTEGTISETPPTNPTYE